MKLQDWRPSARPGFTLIELLVTMGLIVTLLSIAVAVSNSSAVDSYKLVGSADKAAQALLQAKSRALRDKAPRGLRFDVGEDGLIRELVFIESGEPWLPDQGEYLEFVQGEPVGANNPQVISPARSLFVIKFPVVPAQPTGQFPKPTDTPNYLQCKAYVILNHDPTTRPANRTNNTQRGATDFERFQAEVLRNAEEMLWSPDLGAGVRIGNWTDVTGVANTLDPTVIPTPTANYRVIDLDARVLVNPNLGAGFTDLASGNANIRNRATFQTTAWGIHHPPRPIAGEPSLLLSKNVVIDSYASLNGPTPGVPPVAAGTNFDVLFSPSGQVMNQTAGVIALAVRDSYKFPTPTTAAPNNWLTNPTNAANDYRRAGEMILVAIYPKTGTVATKPVQEPLAGQDPYFFAKDAINSGL
jgi:prepilin-type N-terminal cleavage/methylation domain-containing protein